MNYIKFSIICILAAMSVAKSEEQKWVSLVPQYNNFIGHYRTAIIQNDHQFVIGKLQVRIYKNTLTGVEMRKEMQSVFKIIKKKKSEEFYIYRISNNAEYMFCVIKDDVMKIYGKDFKYKFSLIRTKDFNKFMPEIIKDESLELEFKQLLKNDKTDKEKKQKKQVRELQKQTTVLEIK